MHDRAHAGHRLLALGQAWIVLAVMSLGLSLLSYRRLKSLGGARQALPLAPDAIGHTIAARVARAGRFVPRSTCLARAMAARYLLAGEGWGSTLHVGVARLQTDGRFEAHAWLDCAHATVIGGDVAGFADYVPLNGFR